MIAQFSLKVLVQIWDNLDFNSTGFSHKLGCGLPAIDILHAVLASRLNCDRIATFDNDFDEISDYIPRLNVRKEYGGAGLSK